MRLISMLFLMFALGCSSDKKKVPMPMDQIPASVMTIAKEKLPDVSFERAFKEPNGDYELVGKDKKGKTREIDISPAGEVTQIE